MTGTENGLVNDPENLAEKGIASGNENAADAKHSSSPAEDAVADVRGNGQILSYRQHLAAMSKVTYPIIISEVFQNVLPVVDLGFVGQLGKRELAAAALATVWFNLWNSTMLGFLTATDTMLAQSYGANQRDGFAAWAGASLVVVFLMTFVTSGIIALCGPAMRSFGQDPDLADAAGEFSYRLIPGLFPYYLFKVLTKYLQTQNRLAPGVWIGALANVTNVLLNWGLIFGAGWGLAGAPWATTLTRLAEFLLIVLYMLVRKSSLKDTWPKFSRASLGFKALKPFWKLAMSGALCFSAEAWSFEVTTIMAGLLGTVALDAHIITLTIASFIFFSFPFAVGIAASIRVGQLIGDQQTKDAQRSSHTSYFLSIFVQAILMIILWSSKDIIGNLMSSDEEVAHIVSQLIPIMCIFMMGDSVLAVTGGVLRGLGRQKLVLWLNILGFWVLAVPSGAILTFVGNLGVFGLWWGMLIGVYITCVIGLWFLHQEDWNRQVTKSLKRMSSILRLPSEDLCSDSHPDEASSG